MVTFMEYKKLRDKRNVLRDNYEKADYQESITMKKIIKAYDRQLEKIEKYFPDWIPKYNQYKMDH